ncbi:MAG: hypothetical protein SOZ11_03605 [Bacilli bacterium]|nr:hypothetical protein [Bacilli bacterium]
MEVVKENVESKKNILEYLKSIDVNSSNKHEEIELDNYVVCVVMITTESTTLNSCEKDFCVYLLIQDKKDKKIYGKFFNQNFVSDNSAKNYYNELKEKAILLSTDDIKKMLEK